MTEETNAPEQTGGSEVAPIVDVEEAAVRAQEELKAADEAKAKQAELALEPAEDSEIEKLKKEIAWRDKELKKKHAQKKDRDSELEIARQKIRDLEELAAKAQAARDPDTGKFVAQEEVRAPVRSTQDDIKAEAAKLVAAERFAADCAAAEARGKELYKDDFEKAVENLQMKGGFDEATLRGILATDDPSKVLFELGKNPAEYDRIMSLAPEKRIAEMTKISIAQPPKPKLSAAPPPTEPVGGRGGPTMGDLRDDQNDDDWYAIRDRQAKEAWLKKTGRAA